MRAPAGVVVVAGPDRTRRAATTAALAAATTERGWAVVTVEWAARSGEGRPRRGPIRSLLVAAVELMRYRVAMAAWRRDGRHRLVVVTGSWYDLLLGAEGHGLADRVVALAGPLRLLVPRAESVVVVDPDLGDHRRPRPDDDWSPWGWTQFAPWIGRQVLWSDGRAPDDGARVLRLLCRPSGVEEAPARWLRAPLSRRRFDLRATAGPASRPALAMSPPRGGVGRLVLRLNSAAVSAGVGLPSVSPVDDLRQLCESVGLSADGFATRRSAELGRRTVACAARGRLVAVIKVGPAEDAGLRRDAEVLRRLAGGGGTIVVPTVRWAGEWRGRFALVTDAIPNLGPPRPGVDGAVVDLCVALAGGEPWGAPVVHGDLAPWNLLDLGGSLALVDWENARFEVDPLFDLTHYVIQQGALLGRIRPAEALEHLVAEGSAGWRYLSALGIDPGQAPELVRSYLARVPAPTPYHHRLGDLLPAG